MRLEMIQVFQDWWLVWDLGWNTIASLMLKSAFWRATVSLSFHFLNVGHSGCSLEHYYPAKFSDLFLQDYHPMHLAISALPGDISSGARTLKAARSFPGH